MGRKIYSTPQKANRKITRQDKRKFFSPLSGTALFLILALIGVLNHEMWRDEFQAWLVARDAHSLSQLYQNVKYEGNPMLWHLVLYVITIFTSNPALMQIIHILIATGFVYLFLKYSDFPVPVKLLFLFGYFILFEYTLISRGYGLGLLLVFSFLALFKNRTGNYIFLSIILFLLSNSTVYGLVISMGLGCLIIADYFFHVRKSRHPGPSPIMLFTSLFIFLLGLFVSAIQIYPEPDNTFPAFYAAKLFDPYRIKFVLGQVFVAHIPIPDFTSDNYWNSSLLLHEPGWIFAFSGIVIVLLSALIFIRHPYIVILYLALTTLLTGLFYYSGLMWLRYTGHLFIVFIMCFWLLSCFDEYHYKNRMLLKLSVFSKKISTPFLIFILLLQLIGGVVSYVKDLQLPFSSGEKASRYIQSKHLDNFPIVGSTDFIISPLSAMLDNQIYYGERDEFGSFVIWDSKRKKDMQFSDIIKAMQNVIQTGRDTLILALSSPLLDPSGNNQIVEQGKFSQDLSFRLLKYFPAGVVDDEKYAIYQVIHSH